MIHFLHNLFDKDICPSSFEFLPGSFEGQKHTIADSNCNLTCLNFVQKTIGSVSFLLVLQISLLSRERNSKLHIFLENIKGYTMFGQIFFYFLYGFSSDPKHA